MNDFLSYILYLLQRGIWFAVPAVFLCVLALAGAWGVSRKKGRPFPWGRAAALLLLIGWLGLTLFVTLLRSEPGFREWNFHLFLAWREAWNQFALRAWLNVLLNIALFVPLGLLLPLLSHRFRSWYAMLPAGLAVSLAIELGQLATARGMFDVDDLFTNTLGAMVGWGMVLLIQTVRERSAGWKVRCLGYDIVTLVPEGEEPILNPAQAVEALYHGHSFQGALLEREQARQITVLSCTLDWKGDTKGFYQPVYRFELQLGGETVTDYVAALQ